MNRIENCKKFSLIALCLVLFSGLIQAGELRSMASFRSDRHLFLATSSSFTADVFMAGGQMLAENPSVEDSSFEKEYRAYQKIVRCKKKFKRTFTYSTRLKQPVKDIAIAWTDIFTDETYNKPYFLSHQHHFLFRLTPF